MSLNRTAQLALVSLVTLVQGFAQPSPANASSQPGPKQPFTVTTTSRAPFQPGGLIRIQNSYGYLTVEGWDEPEVAVTITKSTDKFYEPGRKAEADRLFDQVRVTTERRSDKELVISTVLPHRITPISRRLPSGQVIVTTPVPSNHERHVTVEYQITVPRESRLAIHHDNGYVWVSDVSGGIEVHSHTGDMTVMLPDLAGYSIDAKTGLGRISSDIAGRTSLPLLFGARLNFAGKTPSRRVYLRMGRGSITIKSGAASAYYGKN